ncbi:MAG: flagellar protein FlgN [Planctomycetota bacterium]
MVEEYLTALQENLEQESSVQASIRSLLDRQMEVVLAGDRETLAQVLDELESQVAASRHLQLRRQGILERLGKELGMGPADVTLNRVFELLGERVTEIMRERERLGSLVRDVQTLNRKSQMLVRESLAMIDEVLRSVSGSDLPPKAYDAGGRIAHTPPGTVVDRRG